MSKHRSPRNRVSKHVPSHNTDDTDNLSIPDTPDTPDTFALDAFNPDTFSPTEALQRLHLELVQLEAVANAASEAVVELPYPSGREARRPFERVYALVGLFADGTNAAVKLGGQMMDALNAYLQRKHADQ